YYDNGDSGNYTFQQLGLGWELLGEIFDLRGNFYLPMGKKVNQFNVVDQLIGYQAYNILLQENADFEVAQRGLDIDAGVVIPISDVARLRASLGYYNYQGSNADQVHGVRARLHGEVLDLLTFEVSAQNDHVSHTTVYGGVGIRFGGP